MNGARSSVYGKFQRAAAEAPSAGFLCYPPSPTREYFPEGVEYTYAQALDLVDALAERYAMAGYRPGHRVALVAGNRPEHFWHLLALNKIGASVVTLNPEYLPHEMAYAISLPSAALIVTARSYAETVKAAVAMTGVPPGIVDASDAGATIPAPVFVPVAPQVSEIDREALIIYTSGTTGKPKGCMISNRSCLAAAESYTSAGGLLSFEPGKERLYIPLPAFHMNVSVYTLNSIIFLRSCLIMQDRFSSSRWWTDLAATRATCFHYLGVIPPVLLKMPVSEAESLHHLKFGYGAGVDPAVRAAFEGRFGVPLVEGWGMTETSRAIQNSGLPRCLEPRAFGRPRPPLQVRVVDEQDCDVPTGQTGELIVRAEGSDPRSGFFSGYVNLPEETEVAWRGGWFHTGDVVRRAEDGMLTFVDRRKNIIRRSGENIAAAEVEEAFALLPQVSIAAVLAIEDSIHDEEVMTCIVLAEGVDSSMELAQQLLMAASKHLAWFKLPAWMAFVDRIAVTGTQKIQKGSIFPLGEDPRSDSRTLDLRALKQNLRPGRAASS